MDFIFLFLIWLILHETNSQSNENNRQKRYLTFTRGTQWGVFATVSVPLHPETLVSVAWFFEANYFTIDNATWLEPLLGDIEVPRSKEERSAQESRKPKDLITRRRLYTFIETMLENHGYPGQPCLFRSICENAASHFLHNGILGDVLHLFLTPSASTSEEYLEDSYYEAEYLGTENQCEFYQHECPNSPLELISIDAEKFAYT